MERGLSAPVGHSPTFLGLVRMSRDLLPPAPADRHLDTGFPGASVRRALRLSGLRQPMALGQPRICWRVRRAGSDAHITSPTFSTGLILESIPSNAPGGRVSSALLINRTPVIHSREVETGRSPRRSNRLMSVRQHAGILPDGWVKRSGFGCRAGITRAGGAFSELFEDDWRQSPLQYSKF